MKQRAKKLIGCLMAAFMILTMCSISTKAEPPIGTTPEKVDLKQMIDDATAGDSIKLESYAECTSDLEINKNITIDLNGNNIILQRNNNSINQSDSKFYSIIIIDGAKVDFINSFNLTNSDIFTKYLQQLLLLN